MVEVSVYIDLSYWNKFLTAMLKFGKPIPKYYQITLILFVQSQLWLIFLSVIYS